MIDPSLASKDVVGEPLPSGAMRDIAWTNPNLQIADGLKEGQVDPGRRPVNPYDEWPYFPQPWPNHWDDRAAPCPSGEVCACGQCALCDSDPSISPPSVGHAQPRMTFVPPGDTGQAHGAVSYPAGTGFFLHRQHSAGPGGSLQGTQEIRFVDGTVHVLERYTGPVAGSSTPWRITKRLDAYDNLTLYRYGSDGRLARIEYPNGVDEVYDYAPSWIGSTKWPNTGSGIRYSGIEVRFVDRPTGAALPDRTVRYVFLKRSSVDHGTVTAVDSQGQVVPGVEPATAPFNGDLLFRVYLPQTRILDDLANLHDNVLYDLGTDQARHRILEYSYVTGTSLPASIGVRFANGITDDDSVLTDYVRYEYEQVGGRARVQRETYPIEGIHYDWTYVCDTGVFDQYGQNPTILTQRLSSLGAKQLWTFDVQGRILTDTFEPRTGTAVEDRALDPAYDASRHASGQLAFYQTTYEYGASCSCGGKPTAVVRPGGGRTEFDYDAVTGLITEMREPDPQSPTGYAVTAYEWEPAVQGDLYGRYRLKSMTAADGNVWSYAYTSTARMDPNHGTKDSERITTTPAITGSVASSATLQVVQNYNVSHPILSLEGAQAVLVGQVTTVTDEDGLETEYVYDSRGWLDRSTVNPGGGVDEIVNEFDHDSWGRLLQVRMRIGSPQALTTNYEWDGQGSLAKVAMTVDGVLHEQEFYYDRWGNLSVARNTNKTSSGSAPNDFHPTNPRTDTARDWIREEWHYQRGFLAAHFTDRRSLDRNDSGSVADAVDSSMAKTDLSWTADGWIHQIVNAAGNVRQFSYDGFGVPFREVVLDPAGGEIVVARQFVDAALLPIAIVDGNGAETEISRSLKTGLVSSVREPATASTPPNYPWSVSRAESVLSYDSMGRVVSVTESVVGGAVLRKRVATFDQIGRPWKNEIFEGASATPSQTYQRQWTGGRLSREEYPGGRHVTWAYDALGRLELVSDSLSASANRVRRSYFDKSPFVSRVVSELWDEAAPTQAHVNRPVEYALDELGRVKVMKVARSDGAAGTLDHTFAYYTTGATESYTDPSGKVERFLPDAQGRLVERFLPGANPIWNGTEYQDWTGVSGRSQMFQTDGLGHQTKTIFDFAGRPVVVMEPGATVEPTAANPHQAFARLMAYDAASRLVGSYSSDDIEIAFHRDAVGRLIQRQRVVDLNTINQSVVSWLWYYDNLRRDALGQVVETGSFTLVGDEVIHENFSRDALGRTTMESFDFIGGVPGPDVISTYDGGDPFRTGVGILNSGSLQDLQMSYTPDGAGRVAAIEWAVGSTGVVLAEYLHEGGRVRQRNTSMGLGGTSGSFGTDYEYDVYGRMERIEQSFDASAFVEFRYDAASNLVREVYNKHSGAKGDRFAYDEHHRLLTAWMDSSQADQATQDSSETFIKKLTYGLDAANNRTSVSEQAGAGGSTTTTPYVLDADSNRYEQINGLTWVYDSRGNLRWNPLKGLLFVWDAKGLLREVYRSQPVGQAESSSAQQSTASSTQSAKSFEVQDISALDAARRMITQRLAALPNVVELAASPTIRAARTESLGTSNVTVMEEGQATAEESELVLLAWYLYDAFDRRVTRWVADDGTYYSAWDGWQEAQVVVDRAQMAQEIKQFVWGEQLDELVAYRRSTDQGATWSNYYIAEGGAHCPVRLLDETGNVIETQEYDPYGRVTYYANGIESPASQYGNAYGWRGRPFDHETGLGYWRYRMYDPDTGRFASQDPLGYGGDSATWLNTYGYGAASPLVQADPLGLQVTAWIGGAGERTMHDIMKTAHDAAHGKGAHKLFTYDEMDKAADWVAGEYSKQKGKGNRPVTVTIIGHSWGGGNSQALADLLKKKGVPVDIVVTLDPVAFTPVSKSNNVREWVNCYQESSLVDYAYYVDVYGKVGTLWWSVFKWGYSKVGLFTEDEVREGWNNTVGTWGGQLGAEDDAENIVSEAEHGDAEALLKDAMNNSSSLSDKLVKTGILKRL